MKQFFIAILLVYNTVVAINQVPFNLNKQLNTLQLKHIYHHASAHGPIPRLFRRADITNVHTTSVSLPLTTRWSIVDRPATINTIAMLNSNDKYKRWNQINNHFQAWDLESSIQLVPDVQDRETVISLAKMTNNAYLDINLNNTEWYDLDAPWQLNNSFGWESDGIRGHVFSNADDSLVVISIKGTSAGLWTGGPTGEKDKLNDNMLFSCCCARISRAWTPVCDCYQGNEYKCESYCLQKAIQHTELYYDNAMRIFEEVFNTYNNSNIFITGHSLGGAVAALVGQTFGIPTVTFEIPGDRLASQRLHLPHGKGVPNLPVWHFGHTGDPIFVGVCTGPASSCWYGGFAMESRCHTGKVCVWDTVKDHGWRVDIRSHRVRDVIENILLKDEQEFPMPICTEETECEDCGLWEYFDIRDPAVNKTTGLY